MKQRTVIIVAASPLVGEGLKAALGDDPSMHVPAPVRRFDDIDWSIAPDAVVAAAIDLHQGRTAKVPLVLLCDVPVTLRHLESDGTPIAVLGASASPEQVRAAVGAVLAGLHAWSHDVDPGAAAVLASSTNVDEPSGDPLTPRELEVFDLLAKGLSNRDIAVALGISAHTAKYHVAQILAKIGAATRAEAVAIGLRLGLIGM